MEKSTLFRYALLILCLGAFSALAQEPGIIPPPIPSVLPPDPPDPDTLPPPPQFQWESLTPRDSEGEGGTTAAVSVPPPEPETPLAPPPPPVVENPLPGGLDPAELELAKPDVEIWRDESEYPQIPARRSSRLAISYVTGTAPVSLLVQFDPAMAGKSVYVKPGPGITLNPPALFQTISGSGECLVLAQVAEGVNRSHVIFYCEGVKTVLPIMRAPLATVEANEAQTGGGE